MTEKEVSCSGGRYRVTLTYDPEYKGYVADVPDLPGCVSQGKTVEEALENVKEAVSLYLETVRG